MYKPNIEYIVLMEQIYYYLKLQIFYFPSHQHFNHYSYLLIQLNLFDCLLNVLFLKLHLKTYPTNHQDDQVFLNMRLPTK